MRRIILLLIVPYGIETISNWNSFDFCIILLIVPYGIETKLSIINGATVVLLIVPYGIETIIPVSILIVPQHIF